MKDQYDPDNQVKLDPSEAAKPIKMNRHQRRAEAKRLQLATREAKRAVYEKFEKLVNALPEDQVNLDGLRDQLRKLNESA